MSSATENSPPFRAEDAPEEETQLEVSRVRNAYEQVADQLRELILHGTISEGTRLPGESELANHFGVSRTTIREAMRVLSTQNLVRSARGARGGTYVTLPGIEHVSESLHEGLDTLVAAQRISLGSFLEAREMLEVPAAMLAAERHDEGVLERLRGAVPAEPLDLSVPQQFTHNRDFHSVLVEASGNAVLYVCTLPIFTLLQTNLSRTKLGPHFHTGVNAQHRALTEAIASGDADRAGEEMTEHLRFLRTFYEDAWSDLGLDHEQRDEGGGSPDRPPER
jgi:GntR family transcriptional repressor for pyruvate dehydrogenase complex